jgi:hypothetical protein
LRFAVPALKDVYKSERPARKGLRQEVIQI